MNDEPVNTTAKQTIRQIATLYGVEPHNIGYIIRTRKIQPCDRRGKTLFYDDSAVATIRLEMNKRSPEFRAMFKRPDPQAQFRAALERIEANQRLLLKYGRVLHLRSQVAEIKLNALMRTVENDARVTEAVKALRAELVKLEDEECSADWWKSETAQIPDDVAGRRTTNE
jgi:hypothetical protein